MPTATGALKTTCACAAANGGVSEASERSFGAWVCSVSGEVVLCVSLAQSKEFEEPWEFHFGRRVCHDMYEL